MNNNYSHTSTPTAPRSTLGSPRDIVSLLFRRKTIFIAIFVTIVAASVFSVRNQKIVYVAESKVRVTRGGSPHQGPNQSPRLHWWEEMKTEAETARSRPVAEIAARALAQDEAKRLSRESVDLIGVEVEGPTPETLLAGLGIEVIDETDVIRVTYRAATRSEAIRGCNALTEAYLAHSRDVTRAKEATDFYEEEVQVAEAAVQHYTSEIAAFKAQHKVGDLSSQQIELTRQRNAVENALIEVRTKRIARQRELEAIERSLVADPEVLVPSEEMSDDPNLRPYRGRLAELESKLNTLLATYTRDNPQVRAVERDIEACKMSIQEQVNQLLAAKRNTVEVMRGEEAAYAADLDRIDARLAELPALEAELGMLMVQLTNAKVALEQLNYKYREFELVEEVMPRVGRLNILSDAVSATPVGGGSRKQLFLVFSLILASGLAFVAAFVVDVLDHSIKFPSDIEQALGVPVLASIREVPSAWTPTEVGATETPGS